MRNTSTAAIERRGPFWIAGIAAVLLGGLAVGVFLAASATNRPHPRVGPAVAAIVIQSPSPQASPAGGAAPTATQAPAPVATLAGFACGSSTLRAAQPPAVAAINGVRTGTHPGYDRLVVQFGSGQPRSIEILPQAGNSFTSSPRGNAVTLAGQTGILVIVRGADAHSAYSGKLDFKTGYASLAEVRVLEDFEGQVQLGLGLSGSACYRASTLANPMRLVIDVQAG